MLALVNSFEERRSKALHIGFAQEYQRKFRAFTFNVSMCRSGM